MEGVTEGIPIFTYEFALQILGSEETELCTEMEQNSKFCANGEAVNCTTAQRNTV